MIPLQQLHIFPVLWTPDLDMVLQMGPHKGRVEGDNPLFLPVGHPSFEGGYCRILLALQAAISVFIGSTSQLGMLMLSSIVTSEL